jgi:nucleoside phosphorylase
VERWKLAQGDVAVIATGVGEETCRDALIVGHAHLRPQAVLSVGWAGATCPELQVGEICVAEALRTPDGAEIRPHAETLAIAKGAAQGIGGKPWRFGTALTSPHALPNEETRSDAAAKHGVQWVDMESAVAARVANRLAIPWLSVRAISDTLRDDLNLTPEAMRDESLGPGLFLGMLLTHPGRLRATLRLRRQMRLASERLCQALGILVPPLLEGL